MDVWRANTSNVGLEQPAGEIEQLEKQSAGEIEQLEKQSAGEIEQLEKQPARDMSGITECGEW